MHILLHSEAGVAARAFWGIAAVSWGTALQVPLCLIKPSKAAFQVTAAPAPSSHQGTWQTRNRCGLPLPVTPVGKEASRCNPGPLMAVVFAVWDARPRRAPRPLHPPPAAGPTQSHGLRGDPTSVSPAPIVPLDSRSLSNPPTCCGFTSSPSLPALPSLQSVTARAPITGLSLDPSPLKPHVQSLTSRGPAGHPLPPGSPQ